MENHQIEYQQGEYIKSNTPVEARSLSVYAEIPLRIVQKDKGGNHLYSSDIVFAENKNRILTLNEETKHIDVIALESGRSIYPITVSNY
ncbi:hypothetical protein SAMN04487936_102144 [Halobacillus dabanensis]|uniref:Uncharacterized protein n=1 Tax=Halobacillus dabanensis TaxID=240302 RepID=A0A1I3RA38_HALDA|nr:hypothetical protein [Halobacillus dabanensis]SFJ43178.1 hypothetical protein SAMN04487936_102144 [Halobacillus dabanensis]